MDRPRFRIRHVDMNGFLGRDHHPQPSDEGLVVYPIKLETQFEDPKMGFDDVLQEDGRLLVDGLRVVLEGNTEDEGYVMYLWTCATEDGRVLELLNHELEAL